MVKKEECAWITKDGFCLWHKEPCCRNHPSCCAACVHRVSEHLHARMRAFLGGLRGPIVTHEDLFKLRTRNARRYDVYRACSRKRRFEDYNAAHSKVVYLRRRWGLELFVYECPFCDGYHLTKRKTGQTHVSVCEEAMRFSA